MCAPSCLPLLSVLCVSAPSALNSSLFNFQLSSPPHSITTTVPNPAYTYFSPYAFRNRANAGSPVQCPGAILCTFHFVCKFPTSVSISSTGVVTRCNPPNTISVLGSIPLAASKIASIPPCEHPSTSTNPPGRLIASPNPANSTLPFF